MFSVNSGAYTNRTPGMFGNVMIVSEGSAHVGEDAGMVRCFHRPGAYPRTELVRV